MRKSDVDRAIQELEIERGILDVAIAKLKDVKSKQKPARKPRALKAVGDGKVG